MKRFEYEPRALKPDGFDAWLSEIGDVADVLGAWALVGAWRSAPTDYCRFLITIPGLWEGLIARAQYADRRRYESGVMIGRDARL